MGVNGMGCGVTRRIFLGVSGASLAGLACGGSPAGQTQDPAGNDPVSLTMNPARVGTVQLPPQQGTLDFQKSHLIDMPSVPAPAGVFLNDAEARVVSARDMGGMQGMNGLFRFALPGANSTLATHLGSQNQSYLSDVALLSDNSQVVTAANGFFHNSAFIDFPSELRDFGATLFPGAAVFTRANDADVLWITVSAFSGDRFMNQQDPYLGGALLAYPVISGSVDAEAVEIIPMSGQNSTAIGLRNVGDDEHLLILNSGNYRASSVPSIDIVSAVEARHVGTISLPAGITAQTSTRLAVSEDGQHAFLGTADESGKVLKVSLNDGSISQAIVEAVGFHSSVVLNGGLVFATSFNHERSSMTVLDAEQLSPVATVDLEIGKAGMSAAYAGGVIQLLPHRAVYIEPVEI